MSANGHVAWSPHTEHEELTRAVAAHGLAGTTLIFPDEPLDELAFRRLCGFVSSQRLTGLMWSAVVDGSFPVSAAQLERTEWMHVEALAGTLALERFLLESAASLEAADVPVRVLKGPASARLDYPGPEWRTFGDIDLLVPGEHFDRAVRIFSARGHLRQHPQPRPGFDRRFSKGASFVSPEGLELDLHRTFAMGPFGVRLDLDSLWSDAQPFRLGGHLLHALNAEARFVNACYHAILGERTPRLVPLRDLAQLALTRPLNGDRLHALIRSSKGEAVVSRAVRHAWHALSVADILSISAWAQAYRTDAREAADLATYGTGTSYARTAAASVRALPSWRDRTAFLHALVLPQRSYLDNRHSGRVGRLRSGLTQVTSAKRP